MSFMLLFALQVEVLDVPAAFPNKILWMWTESGLPNHGKQLGPDLRIGLFEQRSPPNRSWIMNCTSLKTGEIAHSWILLRVDLRKELSIMMTAQICVHTL
jgi:hypothetical protein